MLQYYSSLKPWLHPQDWKGIPLVQNALAFLTVSRSFLSNDHPSDTCVTETFTLLENIQDFHHDPAVVNYRPELLAIASLFLALQCHGVSVPGEDDGSFWFTVCILSY